VEVSVPEMELNMCPHTSIIGTRTRASIKCICCFSCAQRSEFIIVKRICTLCGEPRAWGTHHGGLLPPLVHPTYPAAKRLIVQVVGTLRRRRYHKDMRGLIARHIWSFRSNFELW